MVQAKKNKKAVQRKDEKGQMTTFAFQERLNPDHDSLRLSVLALMVLTACDFIFLKEA